MPRLSIPPRLRQPRAWLAPAVTLLHRRWLQQRGFDARAFATEFEDDGGDEEAQPVEAAALGVAVESAK